MHTTPTPPAGLPWLCTVPPATRERLAREMARGSTRTERLQIDGGTQPDWPTDVTGNLVRQTRQMRSGGALVQLVFDLGQLRRRGTRPRQDDAVAVADLHLTLLAGPATALLSLAQRWSVRFGLAPDPRSLAERAWALAQGDPQAPVRRARRPVYARRASARDASLAVLDECLDQVLRNAAGLRDGASDLRVAQVHQLRVGIRRLRSAVRSLAGCLPEPPTGLEDGLRHLFAAMGNARDGDVLDAGVVADLVRAGAPALQPAPPAGHAGALQVLACADTPRCLLGWMGWRMELALADVGPELDMRRHASRRLKRWHQRIVQDAALFDVLDERAVHDLRKRIKRQRYATEFFAPLLPRHGVDRYLDRLADVQDRMGSLNDLFVARDRYQALVQDEPAAWFALGWLAARIAESRASLRPALQRLCGRPAPAV